MAEAIATKTQRITRDQIAAAVGGNPRIIKLFELLLSDVAVTLPDAVVALSEAVDGVAVGAFGGRPEIINDVRSGFGVLVDQDAGGYALRIDLPSLLLAFDSAGARQQPALDVRPGSNVTVVRDAGGFVVSASGGAGSPDDASTIIASRVFGA